jgi:exodeoxyribonuclease V alpha subunit
MTAVDWVVELQPWRDAGVLLAVDVHTAATLARLAGLGPKDRDVVVAAALASRAPRHGHVCLDLLTVHESAKAERERNGDLEPAVGIDALPWPIDLAAWQVDVAASPLVACEGIESSGRPRPLHLDGNLLYLERYRVYENRIVEEIARRAAQEPVALKISKSRRTELFDALSLSSEQRDAAERGASRSLSVIVGGPGTGKTHTVAALLALLLDGTTGEGVDALRIALVAPTGKAAARMGESIAGRATELGSVPGTESLIAQMERAETSTIHRLLGAVPDSTNFRHDRSNPLVYDVVIVDETSMVSMPMLAKLLDAVSPDARIILVGDPGQLASVEAGSVLGDIAGPVADAIVDGTPIPAEPLAACISVLTNSHRFPADSAIGKFAAAVRADDPEAAINVLRAATADASETSLRWHETEATSPEAASIVRSEALETAIATMELAGEGQSAEALAELVKVRVLCAHRRGPFGITRWNAQFEEWLAAGGARLTGFYVGRPVLVTANDRANDLFNGDLGVVVTAGPNVRVAFGSGAEPRLVPPARLSSVETVHAMTIHKSQGSEFEHVVVVMPHQDSRLATRELLYTAVTRASKRVTLLGSEASVRAAIGRRVLRASGLADRLWSSGT